MCQSSLGGMLIAFCLSFIRCRASPAADKESPKYPQFEAPKPWGDDPAKNPRSVEKKSADLAAHVHRGNLAMLTFQSLRFNMIPQSKWEKGVPPVMGGHLMPSGAVAPISTSSGAGTGAPHQFQYHREGMTAEVLQYASSQEAAAALVEMVAAAAGEAIAAKGSFSVAVPGGSAAKALAGLSQKSGIDFSKVHIFFVDERVVPHSSADSNFGALKPLLPAGCQVHAMKEGLPADQAAIEYEGRMLGSAALPRNAAGLPVFDLVLLGMGPDGHVASLFPNRAATAEAKRWVVSVENSPKPPAERISMTLPVLNSAHQVLMYVTGKDKAEALQRVLEVQALPGALPAQMVRPSSGKLRWLLDPEAASQIHPDSWMDQKRHPRSDLAAAAK